MVSLGLSLSLGTWLTLKRELMGVGRGFVISFRANHALTLHRHNEFVFLPLLKVLFEHGIVSSFREYQHFSNHTKIISNMQLSMNIQRNMKFKWKSPLMGKLGENQHGKKKDYQMGKIGKYVGRQVGEIL